MSRLALFLLLLPACTVGEVIGGPSGGDDTGGDDISDVGPDAMPAEDPENFTLTMSPSTLTTTLGTTSHYTLTLTSDNFTGPVTLALSGVPAGWTTTFNPANPVVPLDGELIVDLAVMLPTDTDATTTTIGVTAWADGPGTKAAQASMTVTNDYILEIANGTGTGSHGMPGTLNLPLGATLHIRNGDLTPHRVHSDGGLGFPHQDASMAQGAEYAITPGEVSSYSFYCHDHGVGTGVTNLVVQ